MYQEFSSPPPPTHTHTERHTQTRMCVIVQVVLDAISLEKDVDGFHPHNIGSLAMRGRTPLFVPCTPKVCSGVCVVLC